MSESDDTAPVEELPPFSRLRDMLEADPPADANVVRSDDLGGKVAVITGGASGIGAGVARRLAAGGAHVVIADIDDEGGEAVAKETGGVFVHCDVRCTEGSEAAVAAAEETWGGLDMIHLNAGLTSGTFIDGFDVGSYRRAMGVNLDGVVYGAVAAVPALRRRGGGTIIATASMAGLAPIAMDPFYSASKHAVVGLVRALATLLRSQAIRVQALCPGFVDTPLVAFGRERLIEFGVGLLEVDEVVDAFCLALDDDETGQCWFVVAGRPPDRFRFPAVFELPDDRDQDEE